MKCKDSQLGANLEVVYLLHINIYLYIYIYNEINIEPFISRLKAVTTVSINIRYFMGMMPCHFLYSYRLLDEFTASIFRSIQPNHDTKNQGFCVFIKSSIMPVSPMPSKLMQSIRHPIRFEQGILKEIRESALLIVSCMM